MNCTTTQELLSGHLDGELPPESSARVAEHLAACDSCAREYEAALQTVQRLRAELARDRAPDVLRARIRAAIREEAAGEIAGSLPEEPLEGAHGSVGEATSEPTSEPTRTPTVESPAARRARTGSARWQWQSIPWRIAAAAAVLVAAASSGLTLLATGRGESQPPVAGEVLASHIRSLMPEHLTDVRSSDQHNVKPWFNGRLDFSPAVPRLDDQGFPLVGGRIDYLDGRPVAVVVYSRRQHMINVFTWPAEGDRDSGSDTGQHVETRHGYNILHWRRGGTEYWVASDLNVQELEQFVGLLRRADSAASQAAPPAK
ncbi:MAG TPA: anti-sigma factor [Gemmatimonadaceae bacterium]|jgi:Predicted transmembrane transcriptional regulator (anti-sigma factor)